MKLCTTSETISFAKDLEEQSGKFYKKMAERFDQAINFRLFQEENRKFSIQIQRAYQSVITDAIEGCYAFKLESDDYLLDTGLPEGLDFSAALEKAILIEEKISAFYETAADQSMSLMADIPRNFKMVSRKRQKRIDQLKQK
jgi:hypothetical protein